MSVYLECEKCRKRLKIPEHIVGHRIKCPVCSEVFRAVEEKILARKPAAEPPAPVLPDDDDDLPRPKKKPAVVEPDDDDEPIMMESADEEDEPRPRKKAVIVEDDEPAPRAKRHRRDEDEEDAEAEEKPKKRRAPWYVLLPLLILSLSGVGIAFLWAIGFAYMRQNGLDYFGLDSEHDIDFDKKQMIGIVVAGVATLLCFVFSLIPIRSWLRFVLVLFFLILGYGGSIAAVHWWKDLPFSMNQAAPAPVAETRIR